MVIVILAAARIIFAGEIHDAVEAADIARVKELLSADSDLIAAKTPGGSTPLHLAVGMNHAELTKLLIEEGADINAGTEEGYTPLHWGAYMNAVDAAAVLISSGADIGAKTKEAYTPLQMAINEKADAMARLLVTRTPSTYTDKFLDTRFPEGGRALAAGDLARAYEIFTRLVKEDPANEKINFAYGLTCLSLKDHSRARLAFERVLQINPGNDRARVELARIYLASGQLEPARREFQSVLSHNPPLSVRRNIESYLDEIGKRIKRRHVFGRVDAGYFEDSNVNVGPDSDIISIAPIIFGSQVFTTLLLAEESQPVKDEGYFLSVVLSATYDVGDRDNWLVTADGSYYQNWLDDKPDNECLFYQAAFGLRHTGPRSMFQLPLKAAQITSGHDPLVNLYGISPSHLYVYGREGNIHWLTTGTVEFRDYDKLNDRDGFYVSVGETVRHFFGRQRHSISMGLSVFHDHTDTEVYEYTGKAWKIGGKIRLPWDTTLYSQVRYTTSDYSERETLAPEKRSDDQNQIVVGINKKITQWWGIDINQQRTDNNSTFGLYQYDREVLTISTFCTF